MKQVKITCECFLLLFLFGLTACKKDDPASDAEEGKGLIQISAFGYDGDTLSFRMSIQFGEAGSATELPYEVYADDELLYEGAASTANQDGGLGSFWETGLVELVIPESENSGKTLLIWADPEDKKTLSTYTTEAFVDLYKKEEIIVP